MDVAGEIDGVPYKIWTNELAPCEHDLAAVVHGCEADL
jgi:hypothetical protein